MPITLTNEEIDTMALEAASGDPIERLAIMVHEGLRVVYRKGLTVQATAIRDEDYLDWDDLAPAAKEGRRELARFLVEHNITLPKEWWR